MTELKFGNARLMLGDCRSLLRTLPEASIDAVVTSPPYAMQRKTTYGGIPEEDFPAWMVSVLEAVRPALKPAGSILLNIREHRDAGGMSDYVHHTRLAIRAAGWCEVDELIWIKPNSVPTAPNSLPRRSWERILWFSRVPIPDCDPLDRMRAGVPTSKSIGRWKAKCGLGDGPSSCTTPTHPRRPNFIISPVGQERGIPHPATYPLSLARVLVGMMGRVIVDPFMGSGTTGIAALESGREFVGMDVMPEYFDLAAKRISNVTAGG